jgi:predicted RNA-binding Zn ribbon-like protein
MPEPEFILLGDAIWLDFINTACGRTGPESEGLPDAAAYRRWVAALGLRAESDDDAFDEALRLRSGLLALADALAASQRPPATAISLINDLLRQRGGAEQLTRTGGEWRLQFAPGAPPPARAAIARSAALTLADPLLLVRQCAGADCTLFFTDDSLTQGRRCCSPDACGRTARVERRRGLLR